MTQQILIFEKIEEDLNFLSNLLIKKKYQLITINDKIELLNLINNQSPSPDLILIDLEHNYQTYQEIKKIDKWLNIPIIFINRDSDKVKAEEIFAFGVADYINYPFSPLEILTRIENQLKIKNLEIQLKEANSKLQKLIPHYQKLQKSLEKTKADLAKNSTLDPFIQLPNYEHLCTVLNQEWLRSSRQRVSFSDLSGTNISLIIAQINDFDKYQENYDKELAYSCLKLVANSIKNTVKRPSDLICFYQDKKFAILLPNTDENGAKKVAEIISYNVNDLQIPHNYSNVSDYVTLTMGVATGIPSQALPANILIEVAEQALNEALQEGKEGAIFVDNF